MPEKPTRFPDWATEEQTDPVSGQVNRVEPSEGKKESGWSRAEIPPRQWLNWLTYKSGLWIQWLEDRVESLLDTTGELESERGENLSWGLEVGAGDEVLARADSESSVEDTDWGTELAARCLFGGTYRVSVEHRTPDASGDGLHEVRVLVNGDVQETWSADADDVWHERTVDVTTADGDRIMVETRMSEGDPPRQGETRNRRISGDTQTAAVLVSAGERNRDDVGVVYE